MLHKATLVTLVALGLIASGVALAAGSDPTVQQIYQAARTGQVAQAEQMVSQVLRDHPRSGKAHYVAAEVYARAGEFSTARRQLAEAQALEPGLPFAQPQSVRALETELAQGRFVQRAQRLPYAPYASSGLHQRSSRPWALVLLLIAGAAIIWAVVRRRRRAVYSQYPGPMGMPQSGVGPMGMGGGPASPYPYGYGGAPGSGIMRGIGTGLAMGAGMAAGEALVDHMVSGPERGGIVPPADAGTMTDPSQMNPGMGGDDFGIADSGSWDGGTGLGGGDFGAGGDDGWT